MTDWEKENFYKLVGNRIRQFRERFRLTQTVLANRLNISRASVVNIEKGRQHPPLHLLWDISENLDVSILDLIPSEDEVKPPVNDDQLSKEELDQIRRSADGDLHTEHQLKNFVRKTRTPKERKD